MFWFGADEPPGFLRIWELGFRNPPPEDRLRAAIRDVIRSIPILGCRLSPRRAVWQECEDDPVARILPSQGIGFPDPSLDQFRLYASRTPLDLRRSPPWRILRSQIHDRKTYWQVQFHHNCADATSVGSILNYLLELASGGPVGAPPRARHSTSWPTAPLGCLRPRLPLPTSCEELARQLSAEKRRILEGGTPLAMFSPWTFLRRLPVSLGVRVIRHTARKGLPISGLLSNIGPGERLIPALSRFEVDEFVVHGQTSNLMHFEMWMTEWKGTIFLASSCAGFPGAQGVLDRLMTRLANQLLSLKNGRAKRSFSTEPARSHPRPGERSSA